MKRLVWVLFVMLLFLPLVLAHQPRVGDHLHGTEGEPIAIEDPEVSKAYYRHLEGEPEYYRIVSDVPFSLYLNILVPDIPVERERRFSVEVFDSEGNRVAFLDGPGTEWTEMYEPFGGDNYVMGPEFRKNVSGGEYVIKVFSGDNEGKYVLAVGEIESFPLGEIINTLFLLPQIKQEFFGVPFPLSVFSSPMVSLIIAVIVIIIIIVVFAVVKIWKRRSRRSK